MLGQACETTNISIRNAFTCDLIFCYSFLSTLGLSPWTWKCTGVEIPGTWRVAIQRTHLYLFGFQMCGADDLSGKAKEGRCSTVERRLSQSRLGIMVRKGTEVNRKF